MIAHLSQATCERRTTRSTGTWRLSVVFCAQPRSAGNSARSATTRSGSTPTVRLSAASASRGLPAEGVVEIGYGLVPSARGHGYAAEAVGQLMQIAAAVGATTIRADTELDNDASRRTLEYAGFHQVSADAELYYYEARASR